MTTPTTYFALAQPVVGASDNSWGTEENTIFGLVDGLFATGRWVAAAGTVDAITATYSPAPSPMVLVDGMMVAFRATGANTSTTPTFAPNGLTARTIVKAGGQPLLAGDIPRANYEVMLRYYSVSTRWELLNPANVISGLDAYLSANQSVTNNTWAVVKFDTTSFDTLGAYSASTGQYTPTIAGKYLVSAMFQGQVATLMQDAGLAISKNGILTGAGTRQTWAENGPLSSDTRFTNGMSVTAIVTCNGTTDTIEIDAYVNGTGGTDRFVGDATRGTHVSIVYVGP